MMLLVLLREHCMINHQGGLINRRKYIMNDVCIPMVIVANVINNWVTGMLESSTRGSCDIDYDKK